MYSPKKILIVDDDPDDVDLFYEAVREVDPTADCISKKDGDQALDFLNAEGIKLPDFIFLDLNMPRLNGIQCLAQIKKIKKLSHIPVIIYSTTRRMGDEEESKKLGAIYFLTKPTNFSDICNAIRFILDRKYET